nr:PREDICTED: condensin-2 complex subunit H2-like [Apteryx mantelli mantelli]
MNTCTPHATGAFMLELAGLSPTCFLQERHHEGNPDRAGGAQPSALGDGREPVCLSTCGAPIPVLNFSEDGGAAGPDDDNDCEDDLSVVPEDNVETTPAVDERIEPQRSAPQAKGYVLRERAPAEDPKAHIKVGEARAEGDPAEAVGAGARPRRCGKLPQDCPALPTVLVQVVE